MFDLTDGQPTKKLQFFWIGRITEQLEAPPGLFFGFFSSVTAFQVFITPFFMVLHFSAKIQVTKS